MADTARERLIKCASRLFHIRSYTAVGIQELCEEADVRRGSFYYYFPSKEALVKAVLEYEEEELMERVLNPAFQTGGPPLERFDAFVRLLHDYHIKRSKEEGSSFAGCAVANLGHELGTDHRALREQADAILMRFVEIYRGALDEAVNQGDLPADTDTLKTAKRIRAYTQGLLELGKLGDDHDALIDLGLDVRGLSVRRESA